MIELAVELALARFRLSVAARLGAGLTAVMGPSGAGKTSLLEAIAGLRRRARGRIVVEGRVLLDSATGVDTPPERRRVGYVPQDAGLFPHLTALDNIRFGAGRASSTVDSAIETLAIRPLLRRFPASLSGGEKQRVALARALAHAPRLLLLDEPLAAMDVGLRERVLPYLLRIRDDWKVPILYVTHNVGEALALAGSVLLLRDGALEAQGAPLDLLAAPGLRAEARLGIENLFVGRVTQHDEAAGVTRVTLDGGGSVSAPFDPARTVGSPATVAIRAEDILVCREQPQGLSARNAYPARVLRLDRSGADVTLRCTLEGGDAAWLVRLTPAAVEALSLRPAADVWLAVKSHSIVLI